VTVGQTSHAAVVCRQIGRPCVSAVSELDVDMSTRTMTIGELSFSEGQMLTIDGSTGEVFVGTYGGPSRSSQLACMPAPPRLMPTATCR
jgi:phosphoenolpyruvate synthase/pyruvate phosphate dikinase